MATYRIDLDLLEDAKLEYENAEVTIQEDIETARTVVTNLTTDIYSGEDADTFRSEFTGYIDEDMTKLLGCVRAIRTILENGLDDGRGCKKYCNDFASVLGGSASGISKEATGGELFCDQDVIVSMKDTCKEAVAYAESIEAGADGIDNILSGLSTVSLDSTVYTDSIRKGCEKVKRLEDFSTALTTYASGVESMNDYLKIGLDNCVPYELREYIYSKYGEQVLADSDISIDKAIESYLYWNKEGIQSDELLQKIASGDYSIEELEQFLQLYVDTGFAKDVAVTEAAEEIFKGYEGNTLDEKIYEALRLKGLETDTDYAKIYGYLSADIQGSPYEGKYTQEQLYQIALHFVLTGTPQGKEMPAWWMESNLDCPSDLQVTEENVYEQCWNGEYKEYYTNGYLVLDMISGMGNAKDGDMPCDSNWVLEHLDKGATDEIFGVWYDYNYGAMAEYVSGRGTVRSVKYALAEKYGFRNDYDTTGNYSVYTNEITELSTLQENAYLTKYGHYDSYYEEIFGAKRDRYEQLYEYFEDDSKILALTKEEQQFLADFTCLDMGEAGKVATYRDIHTLAEMLKYNMKDSGSGREVIVEGNTIIIRIEGTTDIYTGKEIETHEYTLEFNSEELFGSYYISAGEYANVMGQYSALRIKEGYLGSVQMEELEKQAIRIMESCYTKEALETLSREEYNELLQSCMISADLSGLVYAGYETEHVRAVESFNELKDTFVNTFGMVVLATSVLLSPTAPLTIALFGADATLALGDGILRISQGDELAGTIEAFAGALALGEFAYIVKSTRGASQVTYSAVSNGKDIDNISINNYAKSGEKIFGEYGEGYSSLADLMSPEDAKVYLKFLKNGSTKGLTKAEIEAIEKVDELLALKKIEYQDILDMRKVNNITEVAEEGVESVLKGGSSPLPVENKNITGMDWYEYFRETYGKENVCWENCNPSEVATAWQGSYPYVGVDTYTNTTLHDGDIIWMGEPFPTGYSTTTEAIADLGNDAQKVFGGLQVKPYYEKGMPFAEYRSSLTPYKVHGELNVAEGFALNNPQFGAGGLAQRFDPNFDYNYANGLLERFEEQAIELTNTRVSLEDYFNMMDEIK